MTKDREHGTYDTIDHALLVVIYAVLTKYIMAV